MRMQVLWVSILLMSVALPAKADQYEYVTLHQATEALEVLSRSREVHEFCVPCGHTSSSPVPVRLIEIGRVWDGESANPYRSGNGATYWQVLVNDEPVDLAYLYVRRKNRWENLALSLGLGARNVPEYLDKHQTSK